MKNTIRIIPVFACLILSFTAIKCKKDKNTLPPETQVGNNTFGCFANGQIITPKGGGLSPNYSCYYQHLFSGDSGYVFQVSGSDYSNRDNIKNVTVGIGGIKIREGLQIPLTDGVQIGMGKGQYTGGKVTYQYIYYTTKTITGMLYIKKFDEVNNIAAGTFWFTAVNSFGDTAKITDGRFDMKYTQ